MEERDCPRCGSLLPDSEEGVCSTCGYEFGRATLFMPAIPKVNPADIKDGSVPLDDFLSQKPDAPPAPPAAAPMMPPVGPPMASQGNQKLWLLLGLILVVLLGVVAALVAVVMQ